ncbi:MAG: hypothetical protein E7673_04520 [Ruminococcaceae bacterium]|nr:hypothetical protein [Oscillospiraceae bacterium]
MKNTRKILTFLLSFALLVACFSVAVFAADDEPAEEKSYEDVLAECGKVLEFYEAGTYFELRVDETGSVVMNESEEAKLLKGGAYSDSVADGALSFISVNPTKINLVQNSPASFGLNLRAKITEASPLSLCVASSETGDFLSLLTISVGSVTHQFDPASLEYKKAEVAIVEGEFFNLSVFVDKGAREDKVAISIVTDAGVTWSTEYSYANDSTDFLSGKFKYNSAYLASTAASFEYVEMYPGTYQRYVDNSKNVDIIAADLFETYNAYVQYKDTDGAFELAEIVAKIAVLYGYPVNDVADEEIRTALVAAFSDCIKVVSAAYAADISEKNAFITASDVDTKDYNDRLAVVNAAVTNKEYITLLENSVYALESGVDFAAMATAFANAEAEAAKLNTIEENTVFVIEELSKISSIYIATYEQLKVAYEAIKDVAIDATYSSELYPESAVIEATQKKNVVVTNYPELDAKAKLFVENVAVAANVENDFSTRYAAYVLAKENIFADVTYDKYLTDTTVEEINAVFAEVDVEMRAVSDVAEQFLSKIREAALTPSYTVKIQALDEAKPYLNIVEKGYPEVEDAIANYYAMREDVDSRKEAAKRYIQAVINVQIATTVKAKMVAIEIAEAFAVLGNESSVEVEGMAMTVTEANIVLSNEKSAISLKATRISNYVAMTASISYKSTLIERRQAINTAISMKADLVDDANEEDVISATELLDKEIAAYNADVNAANAEATENDNTALALLTKTVPAKRIAEVVAIVKKFYE